MQVKRSDINKCVICEHYEQCVTLRYNKIVKDYMQEYEIRDNNGSEFIFVLKCSRYTQNRGITKCGIIKKKKKRRMKCVK